jgi:hypothetical protein
MPNETDNEEGARGMASNMTCTCPPIRSVNAGEDPR